MKQQLPFVFQAIIAACLFFPSVCEPSVASPKLQHITEHFRIEWTETVPQQAVTETAIEAEKYHQKINKLLSIEPKSKTIIFLQGPADKADGSYPHVDRWGRIHLYQFGPSWRSYLNPLAHELVHVFRNDRRLTADWFFEEGFAEYVALRVRSLKNGFPWYGFPITIVAGHWFERGEEITLDALREYHRLLNLPCKAQAYTLRAAFFDYLGLTFGDAAVIAMADEVHSGRLDHYLDYFGSEFGTLTDLWRTDLMEKYRSIDNAEKLSLEYRSESPIQYMEICNQEKLSGVMEKSQVNKPNL